MKTTWEEIQKSMTETYENYTQKKLLPGTVEEKKLQAIASELYALSCYSDFILKQAFVQSATGEYLDRHGELRNCKRKSGTKASGILSFGINEASDTDIIIEKGTVCSKGENPLIQYITNEDVTLASGQTECEVLCTAMENGESFNAQSGEITVLVKAPLGIEYVINRGDMTGGSDDESDSAFRKRIIETFKIPLNGFNKSSIELEVKNIEDYNDCHIKQSSEAGKVDVIVSCTRELTSDDTSKIKSLFPQCELFGVDVQVKNALKTHYNVKALVTMNYIDDKDSIWQKIYDDLYEILTRNRIDYSITLDELRKVVLKYDSVDSVEITSDALLGDLINCDTDSYLLLDNLEVELYEK